MNEQIEKLEHGLMICEVTGTKLVHIEKADAEQILALLKEREAKPVIVTNAYGTRFYHCPKCNRDLYAYIRQRYCSNCGQKVKWE